MKLIDLLVKELPSRGGWPDDVNFITQDGPDCISDASVVSGWEKSPDLRKSEKGKSYWTTPGENSGYGAIIFKNIASSDDHDSSIITREQYEAALKPVPVINYSAHSFLEKGVQHMKDRAAQRDSEDGERSMKGCVDAFNAMFGHNLTETQGWQFMVLLKMARSRNKFNPDNYEDGAAYTGLAGEAHSNEQN